MYNVLWIDDQWDTLDGFIEKAATVYNLSITPYRTSKAGIEAIRSDLDKWDAVILDAKGLDESENEATDVIGLRKAKDFLLSLSKPIPYFIYTGQTDYLSSDFFKSAFGDFYSKYDGYNKILKAVVEAIEKKVENQTIHNYQDLFSSLESLGISEYTKDTFLDILLPLHYKEKEEGFRPVHHYTQLRKVIEYLFRECHRVGLVPDACISNGIINLNQCSLYLAGKNPEKINLRYGEEGDRIIPKHIERIIRSVLELGNTCSHSVELDDEDKEKIEELFRSFKSNYLIYGLTLQLCEAVVWFANYIANHNDKEENLNNCRPVKLLSNTTRNTLDEAKLQYEGKILTPEKDEDGFWHCDECFLSLQYWNEGHVKLKNVTNNTNEKTKIKYPYYAGYEKIIQ